LISSIHEGGPAPVVVDAGAGLSPELRSKPPSALRAEWVVSFRGGAAARVHSEIVFDSGRAVP
jgi:hypothetical protein